MSSGVEVVEPTISPNEMSEFTHCFITATAAEVAPAGWIVGRYFRVGEETMAVVESYEKAVRMPEVNCAGALVRGKQIAPAGLAL